MKAFKILISLVIIVIVAAVIFVATSINSIVTKGIVTVGPKILGVPVAVNDVDISLTGGTAKISGLTIGNPEGFKSERAFYLGDVSVKLDPMSVFSDTVKIYSININDPEITYEIAVGRTNISTLQQNIGKKSSPAAAEDAVAGAESEQVEREASKKVIIDEVSITGATVKAAAVGIERSVLLPEIKLANIGSETDPATFVLATKKILSAVILKLSDSDLSSIAGGIRQQLEGAGGVISDGIKNLGENIKGIFK